MGTPSSVFVYALAAMLLGASRVQSVEPVASGQLVVQGNRLSIYQDLNTSDADQTVNAGEPVRVRTCFGTHPCGGLSPGDPGIAGLRVQGELRGPELPQPILYETVPGGTFVLPGFQREGDYFLENVRLVDASGRVVAESNPATAIIRVRQILLASATVTRMTLSDLAARGIALTQENFQAFNFALGFAFGSETVTIEMPVFYDGSGQASALSRPEVKLDGLPSDVIHAVERWEPPHIVPFVLEVEGSSFEIKEELEEELGGLPLFGAIVVPGNISFLNQFFEAKLIVANGAPAGSGAVLRDVNAALRLPSAGVLRVAGGWSGAGQWIPVVKANGNGALAPAEQGSVTWTLEGLKTGTHTVKIDISAGLARPGRDTMPLGGSAQAAVEVVDPRFHLTFNHPDTVREGEAYTLFVTVTNLSRAPQNLITVNLTSQNISGAHKADPNDAFTRTIETLSPGGAETVEFRLVSDTTGKCVATTFQSDVPGLQGQIQLRTGVGELGIPLSPATLVLPKFANRLPESLLRAKIRELGLAYSLAVAPAGVTPEGLPHVTRSDVERRAIDLGEAGQRLFLKEQLLESLEILALDQLGNRHPLAEFDTLRRSLEKGLLAGAALSEQLRLQQAVRDLSAKQLLEHFATTASYTHPFVMALVIPSGTDAPVLELRQLSAAGTTYLAYTTGETDKTRLRSLPHGEMFSLNETKNGGARVPLAVIGSLDASASYRVWLHAPASGLAQGELYLAVPNEARDGFRIVEYGTITVSPGQALEVVAAKAATEPETDFVLRSALTGLPAAGAPAPFVRTVSLPPFRVIGAVQDFDLDPLGLAVSYLFNRPPGKVSAETGTNYEIRSTFTGLDTASPPQEFTKTSVKKGSAAFLQKSERVVNVRFDSPVSAIEGTYNGQPLIQHQHMLDHTRLVDTRQNPLDPAFPSVTIESGRVGGLVDGKVLEGSGQPVGGATVKLLRWVKPESSGLMEAMGEAQLHVVAQMVTGPDGAFYFDFIEEPHATGRTSGFQIRAEIPAGLDPVEEPERKEEVSSIIRLAGRLAHVNIALLGRGTVTGRLLYQDNQSPAVEGTVTAASTLFQEIKTAPVSPQDGSFRLGGVPVGPLTLTGRDQEGNRVYATVGMDQPGQTRDVLLLLNRSTPPRTGTVTGSVMKLRAGSQVPEPASGARVAVYANGAALETKTPASDGSFRFEKVPEGQIAIQAADFTVSRTPAITNAVLAADQTLSVTLTLSAAVPRTVTGRVLFHDPATNTDVPVAGAPAFIEGPGVFAYTDANGYYRIENVPVQGTGDQQFTVTAIDFGRKLQGRVLLPLITDDPSGTPVMAATIYLQLMTGGIDGVVLDPYGRPLAGADVVLYPLAETQTNSQGRFSFNNVPLGMHDIITHVGDGLGLSTLGYFAQLKNVEVIYGGHRPQVTLQMGGGGRIRVLTRTPGSAVGVLTPLFVTRSYYNEGTKQISKKTLEVTTDQNGRYETGVPVGGFTVRAVNPFHGSKSVSGTIDYPGHIQDVDIQFEPASTVRGQVVDIDGVTPVPGAEVWMSATGFLAQRQTADALGNFEYQLVPPGAVNVTAAAHIGAIDRFGQITGSISGPGQTLELKVVMRPQGTVRGTVKERNGGNPPGGDPPVPFANAQFYLQENSYPYRRFPQGTGWYASNAQGEYQVSGVAAGFVSIIARDPGQVTRQGRTSVEITADFQTVQAPDIVLSTDTGTLEVSVRDPQSGGPAGDCQIFLSNGEATVTDSEGRVSFDALPLGTYSVYAFHAPTGRGGSVSGLALSTAGQLVTGTIQIDTRGQITGTLYDDAARTQRIGSGTILLTGRVNGRAWGTEFTAQVTTGSTAQDLGRFTFDGIPIGTYSLEAAVSTSTRRGGASAVLTATAPTADVAIVLEPAGDVFVRLFEKLSTNPLSEVNPATGVFSVQLRQPQGCFPLPGPAGGCSYFFVQLVPETPAPGHLFRFPATLTARSLKIDVQEASGEQRAGLAQTGSLLGTGTQSDPYRLLLSPKGTLRIQVLNGSGVPVSGASVRVSLGDYSFQTATDASGRASVYAVPAGSILVSATESLNGTGGAAQVSIEFDDDVKDVEVRLSPAVSAAGRILRWSGGSLAPEPGAIVRIHHGAGFGKTQVVLTNAQGEYRFDGLETGAFTMDVLSRDGLGIAGTSGNLAGPNGNLNSIADLVLDEAPPRILSIAPPPGMTNVSRTASVEILFSEPLHPDVTASLTTYFSVKTSSGALAAGSWSASVNAQSQQSVRFVPSAPYENQTAYVIRIAGGPAGVRDQVGRPLTASGDSGSNFTTSDTSGPQVIATFPDLNRPVDPEAILRFDFNEIVSGTQEDLDGDGFEDAGELFYGRNAGGGNVTWVPLPVTLYLTRGGYSLVIQLSPGLSLPDDTGRRKVRVSRLADAGGNAMPVYEREFTLYDNLAPSLLISFPANAPNGELSHGVSYTLLPSFDPVSLNGQPPFGDIDRVEYYLASSTNPDQPASTATFKAQTAPFSFSFVASVSGGETRPFSVWVKAVDTSLNSSGTVRLAMMIVPNQTPRMTGVTVAATQPVAGTSYAGSTIQATVEGLTDPDGNQITLSAELRRENLANPGDPADVITALPGQTVSRPAGGWQDLPAPVLSLVIPMTLPEGTRLLVRARAVDSLGATGTRESSAFAVADDTQNPLIQALDAYRPGDSSPQTEFYAGQKVQFQFRANDAETGVKTVRLRFDSVFPSPQTPVLVSGSTDLYRSAVFAVPIDQVPPGGRDVVVTSIAEDYGGNTSQRTLTIHLTRVNDSVAPTVEWASPVTGGNWPAGYSSVVSPALGTALLLRVKAKDTNVDGQGNSIPGTIVGVGMKGPIDASGALAQEFSEAQLLSGTDEEGVFQLLWRVPNSVPAGTVLNFAVLVTDAGGNTKEEPLTLTATVPGSVFEGTNTSVPASQELSGALFLLDGATVSLYPHQDGSPRAFPTVSLYPGGTLDGSGNLVAHESRLTSPEVTSHNSTTLFYPVSLEISQSINITHGSRVTATGLLGSTATLTMVLPGERGAEQMAGGSHGGLGGFGEAGSQASKSPGSSYGSVRKPSLPGSGGGYAGSQGGAGGGVVRITGPNAIFRIQGDIDVSGESSAATGGAGGSVWIEAQRIEGSGRILANGGNGGIMGHDGRGGGGGGRISISYLEPLAGLPVTLGALGGGDRGQHASMQYFAGAGTIYTQRLDGSGTPGDLRVLNRAGRPAGLTVLPGFSGTNAGAVVDAAVAAAGSATRSLTLNTPYAAGDTVGDRIVVFQDDPLPANQRTWILPVSNHEHVSGVAGQSRQIRLTVPEENAGAVGEIEAALASGKTVTAHARARFGTIQLSGAARLVVNDDVESGVTDPALLNEVSSIVKDAEARVALRGVFPEVTFTSTPPAGNVVPGASLELSYSATDALGIEKVETLWSLTGQTSVRSFTNEPQTVTQGTSPLTFTVPANQPSGPLNYQATVKATSGRTRTSTHTWMVTGDVELPVVTAITLSPVKANDVYTAGDVVTITAAASDDTGLTRIRITVNGQSTDYTSAPVSPAVKVWTAPIVFESTSYQILVEAWDPSGNKGQLTKTFTVEPLINAGTPSVTVTCPRSQAPVPSGYTGFRISAVGTDDIGVAKLEFYREGEAEPFSIKTPATGTPATFSATSDPVTVPVAGSETVVTYVVKVFDASGNWWQTSVPVKVVPATELSASGTNDWPNLVDKVVYLGSGTLAIDQPRTVKGLIILDGATITHSAGGANTLQLTVTETLYIHCGGVIDVSGKGYSGSQTYPGTGPAGELSGGSHLGEGGVHNNPAGQTYGSVYTPREAGAGGQGDGPGGGVVKIEAGILDVNGAIRANGVAQDRAGAGGSIWAVAGEVRGTGSFEAAGANCGNYKGGGGGGAIAIEYVSGTVQYSLNAKGGTSTDPGRYGGAGTVYLKSGTSAYGDLIVDNWGVIGRATVLPALGSGTAQAGTSGAVLATDRTSILDYLVGRWIEVRTSAGTVKGTWRMGSKALVSGKVNLTLVPNGSETIGLAEGDVWRGVYPFDKLTVRNGGRLQSADEVTAASAEYAGGPQGQAAKIETPVVVSGGMSVSGAVDAGTLTVPSLTLNAGATMSARSVTAGTLTVKSGAVLTQLAGSAESLTVKSAGELAVEAGGVIDVSGKGYSGSQTYPGTGPAGELSGGSHLGEGGVHNNPAGQTYGSVYTPREAGAGGQGDGPGGGVVKIEAGILDVNGAIRANGVAQDRAGAGGSIWAVAGEVRGTGSFEAAGANCGNYKGGGGGGAIAIEYVSGTVQYSLNAKGGTSTDPGRYGGAGTVYLKSATSNYGDLIVDNWGVTGRATVLPALGSGTAQAGSSGTVLVTGRPNDIPQYFVGHYVDLRSSSGEAKGLYRIVSVDGKNAVLGSGASVATGDLWRGIYRFDSISVTRGAVLKSTDLEGLYLDSLSISPENIYEGGTATATITLDAPAGSGGVTVSLSSSAPHVASAPATVVISSGSIAGTAIVTGVAPGSATITAAYGATSKSATVLVSLPPAEITSLTLVPINLNAGSSATGTVTLSRAVDGGAVVALASSNPDVASVPSTVSVPDGTAVATFEVTGLREGVATVSATLGSSTKTATVTVLGPRVVSVSVAPSILVIGSTAMGTVTLTIPALSGGYNVPLSSPGGVLQIPSSVTVPEDQLSATFPVGTMPGSQPGTIGLTATADGVTKTVSVHVVNPQEPAEGIDLTEGNASQWQAFADDSAPTSLSDETTLVKSGSTSLKFVTQSTSNTGIRYRVPADGHWDLRARLFLSFWEYAENSNAFDGPQPVVTLRSPAGNFEYQPPDVWMTAGNWRRYIVPLSDLSAYNRTEDGTPLLLDIREIEIRHRSTGSGGFTIYFDGITFTSLLEGEVSEGNAELWQAFAAGAPVPLITDDSARTRAGGQSLKFVTESGSGTGLRYPTSADKPRWDLSGTDRLYFYIWAANNHGFEGAQPVLRLIGPNGSYRYTPLAPLTPNGVWRFFEVPLAGGDGWTRTEEGSVSLTEINQIELWNNNSAGFTLSVDGVSCAQRLPLITATQHVLGTGQTGQVRVELAHPAPQGGRVLNVTVSDPAALELPASVTVPQAETSVTFPVIAGSTIADKTVTIVWNDEGTLRETTVLVSPPPAEITSLVIDPVNLNAGASATATVTLSRAVAGTVVALASSNPDVASVPSTASVPDGAAAATFEVTGLREGAATVSATLGSSTKTATLTVLGPRVASVSVAPSILVIGSSATGSVTLTLPAAPGGYSVALSSTDGVLQTPASVRIPEGQLSATFPVSTMPGTQPGTIGLTATADGVTKTVSVHVVNPQEPAEGIDLTEGNASQWQAFADDSAPTSLSDETTLVKSGSTSLKFVTQSTSNTGIRYRVPADGHWDLRARLFLSFWEYAENSNAFDGPQPVVTLRSPAGNFEYQPPDVWMTAGNWRRYIVPLSDLSAYNRTEDGTPLLLDIREIEIRHRSTGSGGFTIYFDGITFTSLLEGELSEGNAELWEPFADDLAATAVTNDSERIRTGEQSLKFVTESGSGTGLRYPTSADKPRWDLSGTDRLYFYIWAANDQSFQGEQPVLRLIGPNGSYRYTPGGTLTPYGAWRFFEVPLAGGEGWTRTEEGSASLTEINQVEIWSDTWGAGFTLYVDSVATGQRLPLVTVNPRAISTGQTAEVRITLAHAAPVGGRTLNLAVSTPAALQLPAVVTVPEGTASLVFPVTAAEMASDQDVSILWDDDGVVRESRITVLANPVPVVTAQAAPPETVAQGSAFTVSFEAQDDDGIVRVDLDVTGAMTASQSRTLASSQVSGSFDPIMVPAGATGPFTIQVSAIDSRGARGLAAPITLQAVPLGPVVTVTPGVLQAGPGDTIPVTVQAQSPAGVRQIKIQATGAFDYSRLVTLPDAGAPSVSRVIPVPVPTGNISGSVAVKAIAYDSALVSGESSEQTVSIVDTVKPAVWSFETGTNGPVRSGREAQLIAQAADAGGVKSVRFTVGTGGSSSSVETVDPFHASAYMGSVTIPDVASRQNLPVTITVEDNAGNIETLSASLDAVPASHPVIDIVCPDAAIVPVVHGGRLQLRYDIAVDQVTTAVAWMLNGTLVHSSDASGYHEATITIPATGEQWTLEAQMGGTTVATRTLQAASGHIVSEGLITASDTSHENETVIITGDVAIQGQHSFANLFVLQGATTSGGLLVPSDAGAPGEVALNVAGLVYVAGGSRVDAGGSGYWGGYSGRNFEPAGLTVGATPGGTARAGGSAGGLGGSASGTATPAPAFGSVKNPRHAGSGGGADGWSRPGGSGGGIVRISTGPAGHVIVDGAISANGYGSTAGGGGGGSIYISTPAVSGTGVIAASGGQVEFNSMGGSGGGGRIALESRTEFLRMLLSAPSGPHDFADGGAGTIFLKAPGDRNGHFYAENGWTRRDGKTVLPSIGSGTVTFASGRSFRGSSTNWMPGIENNHVDVTRGQEFIGRFAVTALDRATQTLTLELEAEGQLLAGDTYQGVQFFDSIRTESRAHVETTDLIEGARFAIAPGTSLHTASQTVQPAGQPPTISVSISALAARPGDTVTLTVNSADVEGLETLYVSAEGAIGEPVPSVIPLNGATADSRTITLQIPPAAEGDAYIRVFVVDTDGHDVYTTPFQVTVAPILPPVISSISVCPSQSPRVLHGSRITVCVSAGPQPDIGAYGLEIEGSFSWSTYDSLNGCFEVDVPPDATPGTAVVTGLVRDTRNRVVRGATAFQVYPDDRVPVIVDASPRDRSFVASGEALLLGVNTWDDSRIQAVEAWLDGEYYLLQGTSADHWEISASAPTVDTLTQKNLHVRVWDGVGRSVDASSTLWVYPAAAPAIRFLAPSTGALAAPGFPLPVRAEATSTASITTVEFFSDGAAVPFQTFTGGGPFYQTSFAVDPAATEGSTVTIRARVTDARSVSAEAVTSATVVTGEVVTADRTITQEEPLANDTLILAAGTCTLTATRSLSSLLILEGATLTHPAWTSTSTNPGLGLTVSAVSVALGGRIDVSGKGYPGGLSGGNQDTRGVSFDGVAATLAGTGGSHGGRGAGPGEVDGPLPFGAFIEPTTLGGGGGARSDGTASGGAGGGRVWLSAGILSLDGEILANGLASPAPGTGGGAGGSITIATFGAEIFGWGKVDASGGAGVAGGLPGGGGRVHLNWGAWEFKDATASGGSGAAVYAGAGSIHRGAGREFLGLAGRNLTRENARTAASGFAPIGTGAIATVEDAWISRSSGTWREDQRHGFLRVRRGPDTIGTFEIVEIDLALGRARLSDEALGLVQPGDTFQGVHRVGALAVTGGARFESADVVEVESGSVDAASTFESNGISIQTPPEQNCGPVPATSGSPEVNSRKTSGSPHAAGVPGRQRATSPTRTWYPGASRPGRER